MDFTKLLSDYGLIILLVVLLVFMFWSSRRRQAKQKLEQEAKARQTVPGAEVLLQGGLFGTIVEYDPTDLDKPAIVEIAPGVDIKVHSQAILRVVTPGEETVPGDDYLGSESAETEPETAAEAVTDTSDPDSDADAKPNA
ncbi:preprotein translocase subunit YajC [Microbacterium sp. P5_E9]